MIIVSYDISDDKMRTNFSKMLKSNGAIRLQYSVYEVSNTKRIVDNLVAKIEAYAKHFTADDSVILFNVDPDKLTKYGNAIHRDQAIVYFLLCKPGSLCFCNKVCNFFIYRSFFEIFKCMMCDGGYFSLKYLIENAFV